MKVFLANCLYRSDPTRLDLSVLAIQDTGSPATHTGVVSSHLWMESTRSIMPVTFKTSPFDPLKCFSLLENLNYGKGKKNSINLIDLS
jgi:hypothetical protein